MTQDIRELLTPSTELLACGEPTHLAMAFGLVRNELFAQLVEVGFRSVALETDRVAALAVNDFVQNGTGTLDGAMKAFSHTFGDLDHNRQLVAWMREYNRRRPAGDRLSFHGFDIPTETMNAPSPRTYLEHARDYLGLDLDIAALTGDDEQWHRTEAVLDPAMSPGDTPAAHTLRAVADDMLTELYMRAPEASSRAEWVRARTHLTAGLDLLRYHRQSAQPIDETTRLTRMCAIRDAGMARNLLDIRDLEASPTLVFSQNRHLQRNLSSMVMGWEDEMVIEWHSAGAIVSSLLGDRYLFVAGSLGWHAGIGLRAPAGDTYEAQLPTDTWTLVRASTVPPAKTRTDPTRMQGYFPLDQPTVDGADWILHVPDGAAEPA